jgi:hypothetical protein
MFEDARLVHPKDKKEDPDNTMFVFQASDFWGGLHLDPDQIRTSAPWWAPWREATPRLESGFEDADPMTVEESLDEEDSNRRKPNAADKQRRFWRQLERAFEVAGPSALENRNYATYQLQLLGRSEATFARVRHRRQIARRDR